MRGRMWIVPVVGVAALLAIGLTQVTFHTAPKATGFTLAGEQAQLKGSPPKLAALHAEGSKLLATTPDSFKAEIASFKGTPVVVNRWGSWCGPCVYEFPYLQKASTHFGGRVAFLGLDTLDVDSDARRFLAHVPVPYPSFTDSNGHVANALDLPAGTPETIYFNAAGKQVHLHIGVYPTRQLLFSDIRRYARS